MHGPSVFLPVTFVFIFNAFHSLLILVIEDVFYSSTADLNVEYRIHPNTCNDTYHA